MNKPSQVVLFCVLVLGVCGLFRQASAYSVAYEQTVRTKDRIEQTKVFIKDRNFRIEGRSEGKVAIIINNAQGLFGYMPSERAIAKISNPQSSLGLVQHTYNFMGYLNTQNAQIVATQTINGLVCDVYQFQEPGTKKMTKAWVWKERQFPIRMEISGEKGLSVIEARNIKFDVPLGDELFSLPEGIQVMDMSVSPEVMRMIEDIQ